jgi:hypothetical protein
VFLVPNKQLLVTQAEEGVLWSAPRVRLESGPLEAVETDLKRASESTEADEGHHGVAVLLSITRYDTLDSARSE